MTEAAELPTQTGTEPGQAADALASEENRPPARHYTRLALLSTLLDALAAAGKSCAPIDSDDLSPVDEPHTGGRAATVELVELLAPPAGAHVLDLGSGLGGPARYLARHRGCRVTGMDPVREHVEVATELTERCGLADLVSFTEGNPTALPFPDASFDAVLLVHGGMTVVDKARLCAEAYRVLRPGGRYAVYDVMRAAEDGQLSYPVPWASSAEVSYLESPAEYRWLLTEAGFTVDDDVHDLTPLAVRRLSALLDAPEDALPPLGPHVVLGESYRVKLANLLDGLRREVVAPVQLVATR